MELALIVESGRQLVFSVFDSDTGARLQRALDEPPSDVRGIAGRAWGGWVLCYREPASGEIVLQQRRWRHRPDPVRCSYDYVPGNLTRPDRLIIRDEHRTTRTLRRLEIPLRLSDPSDWWRDPFLHDIASVITTYGAIAERQRLWGRGAPG